MASIEPTDEQLATFMQSVPDDQAIVMVNLLRFREQAAYPKNFDATPCAGREAYQRYGQRVMQHLDRVGGRVVWTGSGQAVVIGPQEEAWDEVILVRYPSKRAFIDMVSKPDYQRDAIHRSAALADSRLLCTVVEGAVAATGEL